MLMRREASDESVSFPALLSRFPPGTVHSTSGSHVDTSKGARRDGVLARSAASVFLTCDAEDIM